MATPKSGYRVDGERVPGTTTIISRFKDSSALMHWAFEQGKLAEQGKISNLYDKSSEAADIGTEAHEMIEQYITTGLPQNGSDKATVAYKNAVAWLDITRVEITHQEIQLVSPEYKFGGTPDAIGIIGGKTVLLDWKTSGGVYSDYLIQLAAYKHLVEEGVRLDTGEPIDVKIDGGMYICRFSKETTDFSTHFYADLDSAWEMFKLLRRAYDIDKLLKKR